MVSLASCSRVRRWALAMFAFASAGCAKPSGPIDATVLPPPVARTLPAPSPAPSVASDVERGIVVDLLDGKVTIDGAAVEHDAIRDVLAKKTPSEVAIFRAAKEAPWGSIVHLLDLMKQSGNRAFVLAVRDDRTRRTPPIELPKTGSEWAPSIAPSPSGPPPAMLRRLVRITIDGDGELRVDGADLRGPLRERIRTTLARTSDEKPRVVLMADAAVGLGLVIDATRDAIAEGATVAFGVAPPNDSVAGGTTSGVASVRPWGEPGDTSRPRPRLKRLDACPFPAAADPAGVDMAAATVHIKVDAVGRPTDVLVAGDPGHGFGAAAKACAEKASFEPAKDDAGRAVAGELILRVLFKR